MKTLFSITILVVLGIITNFIAIFILNIAGLPGTFIAGKPGKRSIWQFIFGSFISAIGQSFVYLAYTAFVVNWTILVISEQGVNFIIWPIAFLVVIFPISLNMIRARVENQEMEHGNAQTEALVLTFFLTLIGFFIFVFIPKIMEIIYNWVPYIGS